MGRFRTSPVPSGSTLFAISSLIFDWNPYVQQWVCPKSEMEESTSETRKWKCWIVSQVSRAKVDKHRQVYYRLTLWVIFQNTIYWNMFLIFPENRIWISCKLSPSETVCMKCQILFSGTKKKKKKKNHQTVVKVNAMTRLNKEILIHKETYRRGILKAIDIHYQGRQLC